MQRLVHSAFARLRSFDAQPEVLVNGVPIVEGIDYEWDAHSNDMLFKTVNLGGVFMVEAYDMLVINPHNLLTKKLITGEVLSLLASDCEIYEEDE